MVKNLPTLPLIGVHKLNYVNFVVTIQKIDCLSKLRSSKMTHCCAELVLLDDEPSGTWLAATTNRVVQHTHQSACDIRNGSLETAKPSLSRVHYLLLLNARYISLV